MDYTLEFARQNGKPPFAGKVLTLDDLIPIHELRRALLAITSVLKDKFQSVQLFENYDWHDHDMHITQSREITFTDLDTLLTSDETLYVSRIGEYEVNRAIYPNSLEFLLRIQVLEEDEGDQCPGRWGKFDLCAPELILQEICKTIGSFPDSLTETKTKETTLELMDAKVWFRDG